MAQTCSSMTGPLARISMASKAEAYEWEFTVQNLKFHSCSERVLLLQNIASVNVLESIFDECTYSASSGFGGAMALTSIFTSIVISNSNFADCVASRGAGGAIGVSDSAELSVTSCIFDRCVAGGGTTSVSLRRGGAVWASATGTISFYDA